jgi:hypothetical protein
VFRHTDGDRLPIARRQGKVRPGAARGGHWLVLDSRRHDIINDAEATSFTPLYGIDYRGVQLLAAPLIDCEPHDSGGGHCALLAGRSCRLYLRRQSTSPLAIAETAEVWMRDSELYRAYWW